jgi:hypothetical protein
MALVERIEDGVFRVRLPDGERGLLAGLAGQLRELLESGDSAGLERLFPPAYAQDEDRETEYRLLVHDELLERHLASVDVLETTAQLEVLDENQLSGWMAAINDVRLVLGTILDVAEDMDEIDPDDPRASSFAVYGYLTNLLGQIVNALAGW